MGLDFFQIMIFREYIQLYENQNPDPDSLFTTTNLGIAFLSAKLVSTFINQQVNIRQVNFLKLIRLILVIKLWLN